MSLQNRLRRHGSFHDRRNTLRFAVVPMVALLASLTAALGQTKTPAGGPTIPLAPAAVESLANELSGQIAYNNLVKLAGAPWIRDPKEFSDKFDETRVIHEMVRQYGIPSTRCEKYEESSTVEYPLEGELWIQQPQRRLVARLEADAALIARGSRTADVTGELVYVSPSGLAKLRKAGGAEKLPGKVALMWSHPSAEDGKLLAAAGIQAVIAFNSRQRYLDPDEVVYSSAPYAQHDPLVLGMSISWRQWSELLEDLELGVKVVVRARARVEKYPNRSEVVYSWIPGTEPQAKGIVFTAHLFDGYSKRGANDNISGCVVELEILRALDRLIRSGELPRPRRTIHFVWSNEISGTYAFLKAHPGFADGLSVSLNMDMVGEGLRKNNAVFRISQCPGYLPSYLDGLARSITDYVWRTNDIIFLGYPGGRPGGQYFPRPMVEKNGSLDAFRFDILPAVGGSDHICFNNPSMSVPGLMLIVWPDQWYHADTDTPDKADPTQLKRVAFIGAACAWTAAHCTDEVVGPLTDTVSDYAYQRIAQRDVPRAMARLDAANAQQLADETAQALRLVTWGAGRERAALRSTAQIFSGSQAAKTALDTRLHSWDCYANLLRTHVLRHASWRADQLHTQPPAEPQADDWQRKYQAIVPAIAPAVKGRVFDLSAHDKYQQAVKAHPEVIKALALSRLQSAAILNYVNGQRSIAEICDSVAADLDEMLPRQSVAGYLEFLRSADWLVFSEGKEAPR